MAIGSQGMQVLQLSEEDIPTKSIEILSELADQQSVVLSVPAGFGKRDLGLIAAIEFLISGGAWGLALAPSRRIAVAWADRLRASLRNSAWDAAGWQIVVDGGESSVSERIEQATSEESNRGIVFLSYYQLHGLLLENSTFTHGILHKLGLLIAFGLDQLNPIEVIHVRHLLRVVVLPSQLHGDKLPFFLLSHSPLAKELGACFVPWHISRTKFFQTRLGFSSDTRAIRLTHSPETAVRTTGKDVLIKVLDTIQRTESGGEGTWLVMADSLYVGPEALEILQNSPVLLSVNDVGRLSMGKGGQRGDRLKFAGAVIATDNLHLPSVLRDLNQFLVPAAFLVVVNSPDDPLFASDHQFKLMGQRLPCFDPSDNIALFYGWIALLVAGKSQEFGSVLPMEVLRTTLGLTSSSSFETIIRKMEKEGWIKVVRLSNLPGAVDVGSFSIEGENIDVHAERYCVPFGCSEANPIKFREGTSTNEVKLEIDQFRAETLFPDEFQFEFNRSQFKVKNPEGKDDNFELADMGKVGIDVVGGIGEMVKPNLDITGLAELTQEDLVSPATQWRGEGEYLTRKGGALLFLPLSDCSLLTVSELNAAWLEILAQISFSDEVSSIIGDNLSYQISVAKWRGRLDVKILGHEFVNFQSSVPTRRNLANPLEFQFRDNATYYSLNSMLPKDHRKKMFKVAETMLCRQFAYLRDYVYFCKVGLQKSKDQGLFSLLDNSLQ